MQEEKVDLCCECGRHFFCTLTVCIYMLLSEDSTAAIIVKMGPFSLEDPQDYSVDLRITDGGRPIQTSITKLAIKVCLCFCVISTHTLTAKLYFNIQNYQF